MTRPAYPFYFHAASDRGFRDALSRFATGVTVVSAFVGREKTPVGVTISSFAGLSLDPPLVLFCLDKKARTLPAFVKGATFAVNILAENQEALAKHFSRTPHFKKSGKLHPLALEGSVATLLCKIEKRTKAGDHHIIVGQVKKIFLHPKNPKPLLHGMRRYWKLGAEKR
jgi:flavin reductase (DIM6/NTAB) family NADH-FMN oxidoreductase RutF